MKEKTMVLVGVRKNNRTKETDIRHKDDPNVAYTHTPKKKTILQSTRTFRVCQHQRTHNFLLFLMLTRWRDSVKVKTLSFSFSSFCVEYDLDEEKTCIVILVFAHFLVESDPPYLVDSRSHRSPPTWMHLVFICIYLLTNTFAQQWNTYTFSIVENVMRLVLVQLSPSLRKYHNHHHRRRCRCYYHHRTDYFRVDIPLYHRCRWAVYASGLQKICSHTHKICEIFKCVCVCVRICILHYWTLYAN